MKIAFISSLFPPYAIGGAEQVAAQLTLALRDLGHTVSVVTTCRRNELGGRTYRIDDWQGVPVWRIAPWNLYWHFDKPHEQPGRLVRTGWHAVDLWNPSISAPLREVLSQIQPEIINTHNIDGLSPLVWRIGRQFTPAIVHTLHDYHLMCPRATMSRANGTLCADLCRLCRVYTRYFRLFQGSVKVLIAPAQAIAETHRAAGWTNPVVEIIRNAVEAPPVQLRDVNPDEPLRVLFLSRLEREKGCETLLDVLRRFQDSPGIQFHIAGRGAYERACAAAASLMSNVVWHGFVAGDEKRALLLNSDVFLQISEWRENAPLALIEAQRYGLYIAATAVGGVPEYLRVPEDGELIPPAASDALSDALQRLCARKLEIRCGRPRRVAAASGYGTLEMAREYERVFRAMI